MAVTRGSGGKAEAPGQYAGISWARGNRLGSGVAFVTTPGPAVIIDAMEKPTTQAMPAGSTDRDSILYQLAARPSSLPPKLFYDRLGSTLFTAICELPEYYPTRTEAAIFRTAGNRIASQLSAGFRMIDLGAGDCRKAASLFADLRPATYVAVDISGEFLDNAVSALTREYAGIDMQALVRDFTRPWTIPDEWLADPLLYFYPGSSLGNFSPPAAHEFLLQLPRSRTGDTALLLGLDLVKPIEILEVAYDDPLGVTAAFNRNLLLHANRLLGTDFVLGDWAHRAWFNELDSRIEMHLSALRGLTVNWPGGSRRFAAGETIHTENSYKYRPGDIAPLLRAGGFELEQSYQDERGWFSVVLARASR